MLMFLSLSYVSYNSVKLNSKVTLTMFSNLKSHTFISVIGFVVSESDTLHLLIEFLDFLGNVYFIRMLHYAR